MICVQASPAQFLKHVLLGRQALLLAARHQNARLGVEEYDWGLGTSAVVESRLQDDQVVAVHKVDQSVLLGDVA